MSTERASVRYLVGCNDPFASFVEDPLIIPFLSFMFCLNEDLVSPVVMPAKPQNAKCQKEWVLVAPWVPQF